MRAPGSLVDNSDVKLQISEGFQLGYNIQVDKCAIVFHLQQHLAEMLRKPIFPRRIDMLNANLSQVGCGEANMKKAPR